MMNQGFDYNQLWKEAQMRWLTPSEIYSILQNHERYPITQEPPQKPPGGSLFLFNRRVLRFFRKDGHLWRKKKNGRTVGEAHERLKVGNVDALNCYYARGEQNPSFQRRSYWMLDPAYEHIVLVHYREVAEGRIITSSISNMSTESFPTFNQSTGISKVQHQGITSGTSELYEQNGCSCSPRSVQEVSSKFVIEKYETDHLNTLNRSGTSDLSPQPEVNQALRKLAEQLSLDDDDNGIDFVEKLPAYCTDYEKTQYLGLLDYETKETLQESHESLVQVEESGNQDGYNSIQLFKASGDNEKQKSQSLGSGHSIERKRSPSWTDMLELSSSSTGIYDHERTSLFAPEGVPEFANSRTVPLGPNFPSRNILKHGSDTLLSSSEEFTRQQLDQGENNAENRPKRYQIPLPEVEIQYISGCIHEANSNVVTLRKQNSTDWMGTIDLAGVNSTCPSDFSGMWFDQGQSSISLRSDSSLNVAQKHRFNIREISPEWACSFESTKVIITGDFLCNPSDYPWAIMFGDIEVPVEIVQQGVLLCQTPQHRAGKVTLCITSHNRESCSEAREFEFRGMPNTSSSAGTSLQTYANHATNSTEELLLLVRLVHMLLYGSDALSILEGCVETEIEHTGKSKTKDRWTQITEALLVGCEIPSGTVDWIMQELLKDKLQQWLLSKDQGNEGRGFLLSKQEQGIIHMISGLGYEWALNPILVSGVGINFRDANGWTSLHWAACFGREEMVAALLAAGASAGAVTDPTPQDPVGKTAGAISAASGHRGLAGYLSEVDLTSHLSALTMEESEISKGSAVVEAERAVESIFQRSVHVGGTDDELSLKDSLAAVRNAAQAAARIQAAFRAHSFRKRQQITATSQDDYGLTPEDIHGLSASSKIRRAIHGSCDPKFAKAALAIQKKYRGWKGRKNFLTLRQNVVKIQAHVRGHQGRKKYKEFIWAVSVVEKVILRWRRKGVGLRGFRTEAEFIDEEEEGEDIVKVFRKQKVDAAIDQALSRVLSMVDSPNARQQYRRMLERYCEAKVTNLT